MGRGAQQLLRAFESWTVGDLMRHAFRLSVLGLALLVITPCLTGCGLGGLIKRECTPEADAVMSRLKASPVLESLPPETKGRDIYATKPCDDEDGSGQVGRELTSGLDDATLLTYFREQFPKQGWELKHEQAGLPREPKGLNVGEPNQCFENPAEPNVTLEVSLGIGENPDTDLHVTFVFKGGGAFSCANTTVPPSYR